MNEAPDPLEAELMALRPVEISPELRRRVSERLAERLAVSPPPRHVRWRIAVASGLAAACLVAALIWWKGAGTSQREPIGVRPKSAPSVDVTDAEPTLLAYQRALARSPAQLDALLNAGATARESQAEPVQICAFTRSGALIHALLGED